MAYVVLDLETTGLDSQQDTIIEVGALRFDHPRALQQTGAYAELQLLVNPGRALDPFVANLTGIQDADLAGQAGWTEVRPQVQAFLSAPTTYFVAHNVEFEKSFLEQHGVDLSGLILLDTYDLAFMALPQVSQLNLEALCVRCGVDPGRSHRAYDDALATAKVFAGLLRQVEDLPDEILQQLLAHSPCAGWGFREIWADLAARRNLRKLDRDKPIALPRPLAAVQPGQPEPDGVPAERLPPTQPSFFQISAAAARHGDPTVSSPWTEELAEVLAAEKSRVLLLKPGKSRRAAVATATRRWAVENDRRALLCVPHWENAWGQDTVLKTLEPADGNGSALLPDPDRYLDLDRLNVWKAGRSLDPTEIRLLGKILHWARSTPTAAQEALWLRHELDRLVIWPQLACRPRRFTEPDPDPPPTMPPAAAGMDLPVTVMDHGALLRALQDDPGFAGRFDAIVVDDIWRLIQNLPQFTTRTQSLRHVQYFLDQLHHMAARSPDNAAAQWLGTLEGMTDRLSALQASCESVRAALQDFAQQMDMFSQSEIEKSNPRFAYAISKPVHELSGNPLFDALIARWQRLARSLRELSAAGQAVFDAVPLFDAEEEPVQGRYVCQLQGWLDGVDAFRQGVDHVLHQAGPTAAERREIVRWMEIRQRAEACKFNLTRYCGIDFWQERVLSQCDQALFLHVSRGTPRKGGYLTQRLGIAHLPQTRLDSAPEDAGTMLILNPRDLPDPATPDFKYAVEALLPELTAQITGNAVFMLGNKGQRKTVAAVLRRHWQGKPVHILEDERESAETVLEALAAPQPTIFCGTPSTMQALPWEGVDVQCVLLERLPFAPFQDPLLDHQSRYAPKALHRFSDQTLPICAYNLMRAADLLDDAPEQPTALVLLDARLITKSYGPRLKKALPLGTWQHPTVENLPGTLQAWLAPA